MTPSTSERILPWMLRLGWLAVVVLGGAAIDGATDGRSDAVRLTAQYGGLAVWLVGVVAMAVPAVVSLTATRVVTPLAAVAAVIAWVAGTEVVDGAVFLAVSILTILVAFSGEVGRAFVQASAYGEEDRHPLRSPAAYALAGGLAWALWAAALFGGGLLLAGRLWLPGGVLAAVAIVGLVWAWPRWHRLSRRWFVIMPAGVVIHDHLVLAETLMLRRNQIGVVHLAPAGTEAADLTGPTGGHAIELVTAAPVTAIRASTPDAPGGTAIHLTAALFAPTRPGRVLRAAAGRGLPVQRPATPPPSTQVSERS